jgi:hypothetical protein
MNLQDNKQPFAAKQVNAKTIQATIQARVAATVATAFGQKNSRNRSCFWMFSDTWTKRTYIRYPTILTGL